MPVNINELNIQSSIRSEEAKEEASPEQEQQTLDSIPKELLEELKSQILMECKEMMLELLEKKNRR